MKKIMVCGRNILRKYEREQWLLLNANRESYMTYQIAALLVTVNDLQCTVRRLLRYLENAVCWRERKRHSAVWTAFCYLLIYCKTLKRRYNKYCSVCVSVYTLNDWLFVCFVCCWLNLSLDVCSMSFEVKWAVFKYFLCCRWRTN